MMSGWPDTLRFILTPRMVFQPYSQISMLVYTRIHSARIMLRGKHAHTL